MISVQCICEEDFWESGFLRRDGNTARRRPPLTWWPSGSVSRTMINVERFKVCFGSVKKNELKTFVYLLPQVHYPSKYALCTY